MTKLRWGDLVNFKLNLDKHFEGSCELPRFDSDKLFKTCKLFVNFVQNMCKHGHLNKNTSFCTFREASVYFTIYCLCLLCLKGWNLKDESSNSTFQTNGQTYISTSRATFSQLKNLFLLGNRNQENHSHMVYSRSSRTHFNAILYYCIEVSSVFKVHFDGDLQGGLQGEIWGALQCSTKYVQPLSEGPFLVLLNFTGEVPRKWERTLAWRQPPG